MFRLAIIGGNNYMLPNIGGDMSHHKFTPNVPNCLKTRGSCDQLSAL